ncbi:hypothetical protein ABZ784_35815 [Streptomyces tendae]|uniref:hypothetical protein n=1 Tax=Streptomyces TaxID=1883 RepID=UPI002FDBA6C2
MLARILYGATDWAIAEYFSVTPAEAEELVRSGLAMLRHPDCLQILQSYRDDRDHTLLIDNYLRDQIRDELVRGRLEEAFAPICHLCGLTFVCERLVLHPRGRGRPRKYCSNACRQKAYRKRNH